MSQNKWKDQAACKHFDTDLFFEKYEENESFRPALESICFSCPVQRMCFATGVSRKEWGVWGGVYLEAGKVSKEFGRHKNKKEWGQTWKFLTMENGVRD